MRLDAVRSPIVEVKSGLAYTGCTTPLVYMSTTKRSNRCNGKASRLNMLGLNMRAPDVTVRSGKLVLIAQAVFLSYPRNWEVVSRCGTESVWGTKI